MTIHRYIAIFDTTKRCIDTVSLPNVSQYDNISIYCCISNGYYTNSVDTELCTMLDTTAMQLYQLAKNHAVIIPGIAIHERNYMNTSMCYYYRVTLCISIHVALMKNQTDMISPDFQGRTKTFNTIAEKFLSQDKKFWGNNFFLDRPTYADKIRLHLVYISYSNNIIFHYHTPSCKVQSTLLCSQ